MQMTTRREAGTANLTDHLAPMDSLTGTNHIARGVVERNLHAYSIDRAVAEEQPITVRRIEIAPGDSSRVRRADGRAAGCAEVSAVMKLPDLQQRMEPHAKR